VNPYFTIETFLYYGGGGEIAFAREGMLRLTETIDYNYEL